MYNKQALPHPFGITVFGSAIIRVAPDVAEITFSVSRVEDHPKKAFKATLQSAERVRAFLAAAKFDEVGSSRVMLNAARDNYGKNLGYRGQVDFQVVLYDLDRVEELLSGAVDAGVNDIRTVHFQTTKLKEMRVKVRHDAVLAAREKAELYCAAAGVKLGRVLHIEDVNPDFFRQNVGHLPQAPQQDDEGPLRAVDPASIVVGGAVQMGYEIL